MISKKYGLLFLIICPLMASASDVVMKGEMAAQDLARLQLIAQAGEVEIRGIKTDTVRWRVQLEPQKKGWFTSAAGVRERLGEIKVRSKTDNTTLHLDLDYPDGLDDNNVKHKWRIEVPIAFAVEVNQGAGNLNVSGVQGGVNGDLGAGNLNILDVQGGVEGKLEAGNAKVTVLAGNVSLEVGTGNANVISATSSVGNIELHSGVGNASAEIGNQRLAPTRFGPKADLSHAGEGSDHYRISVGVGNATLEVKK